MSRFGILGLLTLCLMLPSCIFFAEESTKDTPAVCTEAPQTCTEAARTCGMLTQSICGKTTTEDCGTCQAGFSCNADGQCDEDVVCDVEEPQCSDFGQACGTREVEVCGQTRTINCQPCAPNFTCTLENKCECNEAPSLPDGEMCENQDAQCGEILIPLACSDGARMIDCGVCVSDAVCVNNQCVQSYLQEKATEKDAFFGGTIATQNEWLVAGLRGLSKIDLFQLQGKQRAVVFRYDTDAKSWTESQVLKPINVDGKDESQIGGQYGASMAIAGKWLAIGAPGYLNIDRERTGAVYLYESDDVTWTLRHVFYGSVNTKMGQSIALRGQRMIVGAPAVGEGRGQIHVFDYLNKWTPGAVINSPEPGSNFGHDVAISANDVVAVGAPTAMYEPNKSKKGRVFLYSDFTQIPQVLGVPTAEVDISFGTALAFSGDHLLIGAPFFFTVFGRKAGQVFIYARSAEQWERKGFFSSPTPADGDFFGASIATIENKVLVGAPLANGEKGQATLYERAGDNAKVLETVKGIKNKDHFGWSLGLSKYGGFIGVQGFDSDSKNNIGQIQLFPVP